MSCLAAVEQILKQAARARAYPIELRCGAAIVLRVESNEQGIRDIAVIASRLDAIGADKVAVLPAEDSRVKIWIASTRPPRPNEHPNSKWRWGTGQFRAKIIKSYGSN